MQRLQLYKAERSSSSVAAPSSSARENRSPNVVLNVAVIDWHLATLPPPYPPRRRRRIRDAADTQKPVMGIA